MIRLLWVIAGGTAGVTLRYAMVTLLQRGEVGFPWGTFAANLLGCLAIGALGSALWTGRLELREEHQLALFVGVLGGFTTFSSLIWESWVLQQRGMVTAAWVNLLLSNVLGVAAVWIGMRLVRERGGV